MNAWALLQRFRSQACEGARVSETRAERKHPSTDDSRTASHNAWLEENAPDRNYPYCARHQIYFPSPVGIYASTPISPGAERRRPARNHIEKPPKQ